MLCIFTRMKMKLLLHGNNVMVDKLAVAGNDLSVQNDKTNAQIAMSP